MYQVPHNQKGYMTFKERDIYTKEQAIEYAKDFQRYASDHDMYMSEVAEWGAIFEELAERFDLQEEFKENGII